MDKPLTLHYNSLSYYSQKARYFLEEKGLFYEHVKVDLHGGECTTPHFMKKNPAGKVPVLQHGDRFIPDSLAILEYLEDTFVDSPRLTPDPATTEGILVKKFCDMCQDVALEKVTYGIQLFPDLIEDSQVPDFGRQFMIKRMMNPSAVLADLTQKAEKYPDMRDVFLAKCEVAEKMFQFALEPNAREVVLVEVEKCRAILDAAEVQLQKNMDAGQADHWLCSERFGLADIELALLIRRLIMVGLAKSCWRDGKHTNVEKYFERLCERKSFQDISWNVRMTTDMWRFMLRRNGPKLFKTLVFGTLVVAVGYLCYKKVKEQ